jgi:hypothetical protein
MPFTQSKLLEMGAPGHYHLVSRWARRTSGAGRRCGEAFDHAGRSYWIENRLFPLIKCFAMDLNGYAVMGDHFHLVLYNDPSAPSTWPDESVFDRYTRACPAPTQRPTKPHTGQVPKIRSLKSPERLAQVRKTLGSIASFMKLLKRPSTGPIDLGNDKTPPIIPERFYRSAMLNEEQLLEVMLYVDLSPVRAGLANDITECRHTSIERRLLESENEDNCLGALVSGLIAQEAIQMPPTQT